MQDLAKHTFALLALTMVLAPTLISGETLPTRGTRTLDASFGTHGKVTTDFAGGGDLARAVAVQPDGKIVAAGGAITSGGIDFALARYDSDGTLDATFGTGGKVTTDFGSSTDAVFSVALQPDGKIVAAGQAVVGGGGDFALARYNRDGTLDATFGTGGRVTTEFAGGGDLARAVAVQPDGKIVVAGQADIDAGIDFALARYNSDGTLDASFGTGGTVTTDFGFLDQGSSFAQASSLAVQPDGEIVVAGQADVDGSIDFALARYNSDGTLDPSFGTGGIVTTDFGFLDQGFSFAQAFSLAVESDGKIVGAGQAFIGGGYDFALARYNSDGTLDPSFGTGGKVTTDFARTDRAFSVAVQPDGKIVAAGMAFTNQGIDFALARCNRDGTLDVTFGTGGKVTIDFAGSTDMAFSVALQPDGKIVAAGQAVVGGGGDFALARYGRTSFTLAAADYPTVIVESNKGNNANRSPITVIP